MKSLQWLGLAAVLLAGMVLAEEIPDAVTLAVGESRLLNVDLRRAALGSGKVVSLATPEHGQLLLFGESAGITTAQLWLRDGSRRSLRITVTQPGVEELLPQVQSLLQPGGVSAQVVGGYILLQGVRVGSDEQQRAADVAALFPGRVLNFVGQSGWEAMVQMDVRLVEVRRDQMRQLGINWAPTAPGPQLSLSVGTGSDRVALRGSLASTLQSRIDLLQQKGMAFVVAEPTLSCRSGGVARFVSGGEVPIPVTDGLGATDVQYKEYGVILEIKPRADRSGAIYADVEVELSQLDPSVRVGDFPGFVKRRTSTAINVLAGETVALAGLVVKERNRDRQGLPGFSSLPAAGWLFSSSRSHARESELIVLITPRLSTSGQQDARAQRADELMEAGASR
jgi:pilus assembly protein CpaC